MPFIDQGFVHSNRKSKPKKKEMRENEAESDLEPSMQLVIKEYRNKINDHMKNRQYGELEQVLIYLV